MLPLALELTRRLFALPGNVGAGLATRAVEKLVLLSEVPIAGGSGGGSNAACATQLCLLAAQLGRL